MNEMNVQPIVLGDELRQGVQFRLALAPIVIFRPIVRELLGRRELHALRCIRYRLLVGPLGRRDAPAEIGEVLFGSVEVEGADCVGGSEGAHWTGGSPGRFCGRTMIGMSL